MSPDRLPPTVLIIDDDPSLIEALSAALSPSYCVLAASTGRAALAHLEATRADLIILDLVLGDEDGLELLPHLRERSPAPVLVLTGNGTRENLVRSIRAKPDDYLDKPIDLTTLLSRVGALLRGNGEGANPLEGVRARIAREFHRPLTIPDLARSASLSPAHFRRLFRRCFGMTPRAYLEQCRIAYAETLLGDTDVSVKDISARAGFSDPNTFSTAFKRVRGLSPEACRASLHPSAQSRPLALLP